MYDAIKQHFWNTLKHNYFLKKSSNILKKEYRKKHFKLKIRNRERIVKCIAAVTSGNTVGTSRNLEMITGINYRENLNFTKLCGNCVKTL